MHNQILDYVTIRNFEEAITDLQNRGIFSSPVYRITNCASDIVRAVKVCGKVERFAKLFPDNELLKELLK